MAHLREANVFPIPELKFGYHGPEAKMETRAVAGASLTRDRESNVLARDRSFPRHRTTRGLPEEPGFLFARSGPLGRKLFFRIENGIRQLLCGRQAR